ncbi:MAG: hypothetical protein KC468_32975, partial [Myxococcales bacterium]|nr:hypothetical protein [Myxococcales bacterium]
MLGRDGGSGFFVSAGLRADCFAVSVDVALLAALRVAAFSVLGSEDGRSDLLAVAASFPDAGLPAAGLGLPRVSTLLASALAVAGLSSTFDELAAFATSLSLPVVGSTLDSGFACLLSVLLVAVVELVTAGSLVDLLVAAVLLAASLVVVVVVAVLLAAPLVD